MLYILYTSTSWFHRWVYRCCMCASFEILHSLGRVSLHSHVYRLEDSGLRLTEVYEKRPGNETDDLDISEVRPGVHIYCHVLYCTIEGLEGESKWVKWLVGCLPARLRALLPGRHDALLRERHLVVSSCGL